MREAYHHELNQLLDGLATLTGRVEAMMGRATLALLSADVPLAERVIADEADVDARHRRLDDRVVSLLARQQPVAGDLRTVVAALRMSADLQRMGRLAQHVAEVARQRRTETIPPGLRATVEQIGDTAQRVVAIAARAIATRNAGMAAVLRGADDEMDRLQEVLYWNLLGGNSGCPTGTAIDMALIGRYYERYADHAVALASQIAYLAGTGPLDETRASHPIAS